MPGLVHPEHETGPGRAGPEPAFRVHEERADVRVGRRVDAFAPAGGAHAVDFARKARRHVERGAVEGERPDVLRLRLVVERGLAALDPVDLAARRAPGIQRTVRPDRDRRHFLLGQLRLALDFPGSGHAQDLSRIARRDVELARLSPGRGEEDGFGNPLHLHEGAAEQQRPVRGDRNAPRLAGRELGGRVAHPDLHGRRAEPARQQAQGEAQYSPHRRARPHQVLGRTSRVRRADPATGTGCSTESDCRRR